MSVAGLSRAALVLGNISALSISEDALNGEEKRYAVSALFWKSRAEEALLQLQQKRQAGVPLTPALREVLADTAANLTLIVETQQHLIVATGWCSHGLYWCRAESGRLVLSDEECLLAASTGNLSLQPASVMRYLHDDANITPLSSLFKGIGRIPGGCQARFGPGQGEPELVAWPLMLEPITARSRQRELNEALDSTARELVRQANGGLIVAQVSGGLDGLVILASLIAEGGRVLALYGDDGEEQHAINELVVEALRRGIQDGQLNYRWIRRGSIDQDTLEHQQAARCSHLIKGNYLKKNYKLALADAGAGESHEAPVCVVNGYGIDELYSGAKGDASLSTIHPLNPGLALARLVSGWRTSRLGLRWLQWRLRLSGLCDGSAVPDRSLLSRHLVWAGKAGGSLGLCAGKEIGERFDAALHRDGEELGLLLAPLLTPKPTRTQLSAYCKRFIYGFVEQTHLVRFAAQGHAAGLMYNLPFEAGRIRRILEAHSPSLLETLHPKRALKAYLLEKTVDYDAITGAVMRRRSDRSKQLRVATGQFRTGLKRLLGPLISNVRRRRPGGSSQSLNRALQQVGRQHPNQQPGFTALLEELEQISGSNYIKAIETAIRSGEAAAGAFSTKQVYNYAHLVRYVLATRGRPRAC